jgi:hypothetical protein
MSDTPPLAELVSSPDAESTQARSRLNATTMCEKRGEELSLELTLLEIWFGTASTLTRHQMRKLEARWNLANLLRSTFSKLQRAESCPLLMKASVDLAS